VLVAVAAAIALANLSSEAVTGDLIKRIADGPQRAYVLLFIWLGVVLLRGETIHRLHTHLFGLSTDQFHVIHYCGIGLLKLSIMIFFFIPWVAITLVVKGSKA
jgi:hypothetical protein